MRRAIKGVLRRKPKSQGPTEPEEAGSSNAASPAPPSSTETATATNGGGRAGASTGDPFGELVLHDGCCTGNDAVVDIVFIHGLRGHRLNTWQKDNVCWPRDLLPHDVPNCRVITWGYDSKIANALSFASQQSIFGHAESLLGDLSRIRSSGDEARPIIFVCHSLGGLVLKEALIKASLYKSSGRHPSLSTIHGSTVGIIFLGTPHRGSTKESFAKVLERLAWLTFRQPNTELLETLNPSAHILERQRDDFISVSKDIQIVCVREELPTPIGIIVPESSAIFDGFHVRRDAIRADHRDMARFDLNSDPGYRKVLGHIRSLTSAAINGLGLLALQEADEQATNDILRWLRCPTIDDQENRLETAFSGTCSWIFEDFVADNKGHVCDSFKAWLEAAGSSFWISGKAASGKSIMMKDVHHNLLTKTYLRSWAGDRDLVVSGHFFVERGEDRRKSREGMLQSILYDILDSRRHLVQHAFPHSTGRKLVGQPNWEDLTSAMLSLLSRERRTVFFLLIDGLDEYRIVDRLGDYTQDQLDLVYDGDNDDAGWGLSEWIVDGHKEIAQFLTQLGDFPNLKICFSSRELTVFEQEFRVLPRLRIHKHTQTAISAYIQGRLARESPELEDRPAFVSEISDKALGVFLWVKLVVDMVVDGVGDGNTPSELRAALDVVPTRLGGPKGLYMAMLQRVKPQYRDESKRMFQLLMEPSVRARDIITLFLACDGYSRRVNADHLAINDGKPPLPWAAMESRQKQLASRLKSRCAGLLEGEDEVIFMHQTAKEFVSRKLIADGIFPQSKGFTSRPELGLAYMNGLVQRLNCSGVPFVSGKREDLKSTEDIFAFPRKMIQYIEQTCRVTGEFLSIQDDINDSVVDYLHLLDVMDSTCQRLVDESTKPTLKDRWPQFWLFIADNGEGIRLSTVWEGLAVDGRYHRTGCTAIRLKAKYSPFLPTELRRILYLVTRPSRVAHFFEVGGHAMPIWTKHVPLSAPVFVDLFRSGADPNTPLPWPPGIPTKWTCWTVILEQYLWNTWGEVKADEWLDVVHGFVQHGADLLVEWQPMADASEPLTTPQEMIQRAAEKASREYLNTGVWEASGTCRQFMILLDLCRDAKRAQGCSLVHR